MNRSAIPAIITGVIASLYWYLLPLTLNSFSETLGLNDQQLGLITGFFGAGYAAASLIGLLWAHNEDLRLIYRWCGTGAAISFISMLFASGMAALCVAHIIAGFCVGSVYCASLVSLGRNERPIVEYGRLYLAQVVLVVLFVGVTAIQAEGPMVLHEIVIMCSAVAMGVIVVISFSTTSAPVSDNRQKTALAKRLGDFRFSLLPLLAVFLTFSGYTGIYVFLERVEADEVRSVFDYSVISGNIAAGVLGSYCAVTLGERIGMIFPMCAATLVALVAAAAMAATTVPALFFFGATVHGFAWNLGAPYRASLVANSSRNGEAAVLTSGAQSAGDAIGPVMVGSVIYSHSWGMALLLASCFLVAGLLAYGLATYARSPRLSA